MDNIYISILTPPHGVFRSSWSTTVTRSGKGSTPTFLPSIYKYVCSHFFMKCRILYLRRLEFSFVVCTFSVYSATYSVTNNNTNLLYTFHMMPKSCAHLSLGGKGRNSQRLVWRPIPVWLYTQTGPTRRSH